MNLLIPAQDQLTLYRQLFYKQSLVVYFGDHIPSL